MFSTDGSHSKTHVLHWALFGFFVLLQFFLFRSFANREIVWGYPIAHDQTAYLSYSYRMGELIFDRGFYSGTKSQFKECPPTQGFLLMIEVCVFYIFFGISRLTALLTNFLNFILLEAVMLWALRRLYKSWSVAWFGVALVASIKTTFFILGGLFDFRLDFTAFCFFGIYIALVLLSNVYEDLKVSLLASAALVALFLVRYITVVYAAGIMAALVAFLLIAKWMDSQHKELHARRLKHLFVCGILCVVSAVPFLWFSRQEIYRYYFVGHIFNNEKFIRAKEVGITQWMDHFTYYPKNFVKCHFGLNLLLYLLVFLFLVALFKKVKQNGAYFKDVADQLKSVFVPIAFCLISFLAPLAILTSQISKSPIVVGIVATPVVWLFIIVYRVMVFRASRALALCALLMAVVLCGDRLLAGYAGRGPFAYRKDDVRSITAMYTELASYCRRTDNRSPRLSVDNITEFLGNNLLKVEAYERLGIVLDVFGKLGHSIFEIGPDAITGLLNDSDLLISSDRFEYKRGPFPCYDSFQKHRGLIQKKAREDFIFVKEYPLRDMNLSVWVKPSFSIRGTVDDGWVTVDGLRLVIPKEVASSVQTVSFSFKQSEKMRTKTQPQMEAFCVVEGQRVQKLNCEIEQSQGAYRVRCDCPVTQGVSDANIDVLFNQYFEVDQSQASGDSQKLFLLEILDKQTKLKS